MGGRLCKDTFRPWRVHITEYNDSLCHTSTDSLSTSTHSSPFQRPSPDYYIQPHSDSFGCFGTVTHWPVPQSICPNLVQKITEAAQLLYTVCRGRGEPMKIAD